MENIKSKIIPNDLKENIDEILEKQLFNANRYYAESNINISSLMKKELSSSPEEFLQRLINRWNWHNSYYEGLLEPAYNSLIKNSETELSPQEITDLINVYNVSCLVDEATLVMSGSIKKYLEHYCNLKFNSINSALGNESNHLLLTPPLETYFAQYQIDHLFYIYLLKTNSEEITNFKEKLLKKYHANDLTIFDSRFRKKFSKYLNEEISPIDLLKEMKKYSIPEEYKIRHFYFTLEHPDRKAIRDIIIYDNLTEKLFACNLYGISGFLLRKKILEYLNNSKILINNGFIYEFNDEIIINSLEKLKIERKKSMDKEVKPYRQKGNTCAIACMMMVLEYYDKMTKANWYDEKRYYKIYGSKYISGTPFSALAYHFSKNGLNTTIYHSDENLFNNDNNIISERTFNLAMDEYKSFLENAKLSGTSVINGVNIDINLIKKQLENGSLVVLAGEMYNIFHAILITGYENDEFIVCDPLYKSKQKRSISELSSFMNTNIGKWFISVNNKTKEKDDLLTNLDKYEKESFDIMNLNEKDRKLIYEKK